MPLSRPGQLKIRKLVVVGDANASIGANGLTAGSTGSVVPSLSSSDLANVSNKVDGSIIYNTTDETFYGFANGVAVALS